MDRYIGIDVHAQSCTVVVLGPSGKRLRVVVVPTVGAELVALIRGVTGQRHLCFEEGTQSEWLYELLSPHAVEVVVTMPQGKRQGPKNDAGDAAGLADRLRRGDVGVQVYKAPQRCGALRTAVRAHRWLTGDLTRVKNRLRAVARSRGVSAGEALYDPRRRAAKLRELPPRLRPLAEWLGRQHDAVAGLHGEAEAALLEEGRKHATVRLLQTMPGIGPIRAAQLVAVLMTPERFRTKAQLRSYAGLGVVTTVTGEWSYRDGKLHRAAAVQTRGLNRNRQPLLKSIFKGAAMTIVTQVPQDPLAQQFQRQVARGMKPHLAMLTLARRVAAITLSMWKHQEAYDPARHLTATGSGE